MPINESDPLGIGGGIDVSDPLGIAGPIQKMKPTGPSIGPWSPTIGQRLEMANPSLFGGEIQPATGMPEGLVPRVGNAVNSALDYSPFAVRTGVDPTRPFDTLPPRPEGFNAFVNPFLQQVNLRNVLLAGMLPGIFAAKGAGPVLNATKAGISALFGAQGAEQAGQAFGKASVEGIPHLPLSPGDPEAIITNPLLHKAPEYGGTTPQWENLANEILGLAQVAGATVGPHVFGREQPQPSMQGPNRYVSGEMQHGSPEMPFLMKNRPGIPMEDKPQFYETPPLIGERPLTIEQPIVRPGEINPQDPLQIEKGIGFSGEPKQGGQISFQGQGIPSAMQSRVIPKGEQSEQAALMQGGFVPRVEKTKLQSGINPDDLLPAINFAGKLLIGRQGDTHADILERNGIDPRAVAHPDPARGFVNSKTGEFLSRLEAQKQSGIVGTAKAGGLDSMDLPGAAKTKVMRDSGFSDSEIKENLKLQSGLNYDKILPGGKDDPMFPILTRIQDAGYETLYSEHGMGEGDSTPYVVFKRTSADKDARIKEAAKVVGAEVEERPKRIGVYLKESDKVEDIKKDWESFTKYLGGGTKLHSGLPIFDESLWSSKEEAERMKGLFATKLAKTDPQAAEKLKQVTPTKPVDTRTKSIFDNPNATPIHRREGLVAQPGERLGVGDKLGNYINRVKNIASETDKILNPWDVIFDYLDGGKAKFKGPLMENIRKPLDDAWNDHANSYHFYTDPIRDLAKKHKMGEQASSRIGVYLTAQQEGGVRKMIESGISEKSISLILSSMKPEELEIAKSMRMAYDELAPIVQKVAKAIDDVEVKIPDNYAPWAREWRKYKPETDELAKPSLEKGSSIDDVLWPKLKVDQKVKTDSFSIFDRWIKDATHYIASRQLLKDSAKIVKDPKFESKYGKMGQELMTEFLNNYARQGRYKSNQLLDSLRRATSRGVVGFRLPSQLVHLANIPLAMTHAGPLWWNKALNDVMGQEGQTFLKQHFAESFERGGGEPALTELQQTQAGKESLLTKATKAGFAGQRFIDRYVTQAAILGAYMRELDRKGLSAVDYASLPFDKDAARQARVLARRAVASPLYKDVPPALTRGGSLSKSFFQFQNTFLDQWSNIRYEFAQHGIAEAFKGNPKLLAGMLFGLAGMFAVETSIKHGYKVAKKALAGNDKEEDDAYQKELLYEMSRRVPGAGQLQSAIVYGSTGIPAVDVALEIPKETYKMVKSDEPSSKALHGTRAVGAVGELAIPGASQLTDVASALEQRQFFKSHEKRLEEATGKKVPEMPFAERVKAERDYKQKAEKLSPEIKDKAAQRSRENITKRGEELSKEMSKADRQWMESRGLYLPGFDNKIHAGKTLLYLTKDEMERLSKYTLESYNEAMTEVRQKYPQLNENSRDVYFHQRMLAANGKARARIMKELNSLNESNQKTKKRFTVFDNK